MAGGSAEGVLAMADPAVGAADDADDAVWRRRQEKRMMAIQIVKDSPEYRALYKPAPGPDPTDRTIRKRDWERQVAEWKEKIWSEENLMKQINALDLDAPVGHILPHCQNERRQRKRDRVLSRFQKFMNDTRPLKQDQPSHSS